MSFMAVAYVPSFLEDRAAFIKERANGLYGPLSFVISNFIIGIPFLCRYHPLAQKAQQKTKDNPSQPAKPYNSLHNNPLRCRLLLARKLP